MAPAVSVEVEIGSQGAARFFRVGVILQVDCFVLDGTPESLGEDVVARTPFTIHTDLHAGLQQQLGVLRAGEMTPLITVPDRRAGLRQRPLDGRHDKGHFQRLIQFPTDDVAREPVDDRHQVELAAAQPDVGNVNANHTWLG